MGWTRTHRCGLTNLNRDSFDTDYFCLVFFFFAAFFFVAFFFDFLPLNTLSQPSANFLLVPVLTV